MDRETKIGVAVVGFIGFAITCWLLFWGTIITVAHHFIQKYW